MAETTRRKVYDMLVAEKMMVQGFHYPFPSLAYVEKAGLRLPGNPGDVERHAVADCLRTIRNRKAAPAMAAFFLFRAIHHPMR